jgi:hypothetical protein
VSKRLTFISALTIRKGRFVLQVLPLLDGDEGLVPSLTGWPAGVSECFPSLTTLPGMTR